MMGVLIISGSITLIVIVIILYFIYIYNPESVIDVVDINRLPVVSLDLEEEEEEEEEENRPLTCPVSNEWRILQNDQRCNEITWKSVNADKCKGESDILQSGEWACIPGEIQSFVTLITTKKEMTTAERPPAPIDVCNANSVYKETKESIDCNASKDSVLYADYNSKSCLLNNNKLPSGSYICVPRTRGYEQPTLSSPRIENTNWLDPNVWKWSNTIKTKLRKIYNTEFKFNTEQEFLNDWRYLHLQGGGFTNSVRVKENVKYGSNGLNLRVKEIKKGNIDDAAYTAIKNNNVFKDFKYTTAGISSKIAFGYGYYESVYKYAESADIDNAFWLTNVYVPSWAGWEVDINEGWFGTNTDDYKATLLKWAKGYSGGVIYKKENFPSNTRVKQLKDYNTFGLLYTPKIMVWYVNGTPFFHATPNNDKFTKLKNKKGDSVGFPSGNMEIKFSNGRTGTSDSKDNLIKSVMNVKSFTYYG